MSAYTYDENGVLRERYDDTARTVTAYDEAGTETFTRPYTAEENAAADAAQAREVKESNRQTIESALGDALTEIQAIIDTTNATINSSPASYIKTLARAERRIIRLLIRRFDSTS